MVQVPGLGCPALERGRAWLGWCVSGAAQRKGRTQAWELVASGSLGSREGSHNPPHMAGPLLPASRPVMPLCQGSR